MKVSKDGVTDAQELIDLLEDCKDHMEALQVLVEGVDHDTETSLGSSDTTLIAQPGSGDHLYIHHIGMQNLSEDYDIEFELGTWNGSSFTAVRKFVLAPYQPVEIHFRAPLDLGDNLGWRYNYIAGTSPELALFTAYTEVTP